MNNKVLFKLSYGMYIVSSKSGEKFSACIVNTVTQITAENKPKLIVAINKDNYTNSLVKESKKINISILSNKADMLEIGRFGFRSGRDNNKLEGTEYKIGKNNIPIITENIVAYMECDVIDIIDSGTHDLFVLEMQDGEFLDEALTPMTYEYYHSVIKGKTPPKASTYNKEKGE